MRGGGGSILKFADLSSQVKIVFYQSLNYPTGRPNVVIQTTSNRPLHKDQQISWKKQNVIGK